MRKIINKEIDIPQCIKSPEAAQASSLLLSSKQVDLAVHSDSFNSFHFSLCARYSLRAVQCRFFFFFISESSSKRESHWRFKSQWNDAESPRDAQLKLVHDEILIKKFKRQVSARENEAIKGSRQTAKSIIGTLYEAASR